MKEMQTLSLRVPTGWNDMTPEQLRVICRWASKGLNRRTAQMKMFLEYNGIRLCRRADRANGFNTEFRIRYRRHRYWVPSLALRNGAAAFDFVYDKLGAMPFCPLHGVSPRLFGVSFETYYSVDSQIFRYQHDGSPAYMRRAVQLLTGRRRHLSREDSTAVLLWWSGIRYFLKDKYPHVFSGDSTGSDVSPADTLLNILESLNDSSPQENDRILQSDTHYVLSSLENRIIHAEKLRHGHAKR